MDATKMKEDPRYGVNVIGYFKSALGNGETARLIVASLEQHSIPHTLISADFLSPNRGTVESVHTFQKTGKYPVNLFCIDIVYLLPFIRKFGTDFLKDKYNIVLFFWETDIVPADRLKLFSYFNEVWVTTQYNHQCLLSRLSIPIHTIPHPLQFTYTPNHIGKASFGLADKFTFLFSFDFGSNFHRKNPLAVVRAFQKAFPQRSDVQLVIKSHNGQRQPENFHRALESIKGDKRIVWMDESMDQQKRQDLMNACDCYVSLHRSEGFGMTMAEAMLMEKPVIATGYSGNLDFMSPENSFLCGYTLVPIGPNQYPYPSEGVWADVNIDEAAFWMEFVVNNPDEAKEKGKQGRTDVLQYHSFTTVGRIVGDRLEKIANGWDVSSIRLTQNRLGMRLLQDILAYYAKGVWRRAKKLLRA